MTRARTMLAWAFGLPLTLFVAGVLVGAWQAAWIWLAQTVDLSADTGWWIGTGLGVALIGAVIGAIEHGRAC